MKVAILAWLHSIVTFFHNRLAAIETKVGITPPTLEMHPEVQAAADEHAAAQAPAPKAADPAPAAPKAFDWAPFAGQTDRAAFFAFVQKTGRNPQPSDQADAYAAGVVKTETPAPTDSGNPASSFGPLSSFTAPYQHGRFTFEPNKPVEASIQAPAGPYHIQCSGMGGVPGGDTSVRLAVTVKDATGAVVGSGDDNTYASFTSDGGAYTLSMVAAGATVEDVTLAPGLA